MAKQLDGAGAPDFTLNDTQGRPVHLSDYQGDRNVVLVFNRSLL
jgi:peroxiredoxin